jgi:chorismate lyase / 3-hydroxybenzoate synthase
MSKYCWLVDSIGKVDVAPAAAGKLLAAWGFGYRAGEVGQFRIDLPALTPHLELWQSQGKLRCGAIGATAFASDDEFMLCELQLNEDESGGLIRTTEDGYRRILECVAGSQYPHLLRTWCYFSAINHGTGEAERYKQFCVGRARAVGRSDLGVDPAATVIGRVGSSSPWLHMIWLAGKQPGLAIDNTRQRPPKLYSAKFGAEAPRFSRGMLLHSVRGDALLISGTASVVDEESYHPGDLAAQFDEAVRNMETVLQSARLHLKKPGAQFDEGTLLRAYVRDETHIFTVQQLMATQFPRSSFCVLAGEVCRNELLVELEAVHHFS